MPETSNFTSFNVLCKGIASDYWLNIYSLIFMYFNLILSIKSLFLYQFFVQSRLLNGENNLITEVSKKGVVKAFCLYIIFDRARN